MKAVLSRVKEYAEVSVFQSQGYKGCSPEERRERYLAQRYTPIRYAEPVHVWGLGIGMVCQGAFTGWEIGLGDGGIGGLLVALALVSLLYFCLSQILSELASTIPFAGGMFSYSRVALGPWIGFFTGLSENLQYIFILAIYTIGAGSVFQIVLGMNNKAGQWVGLLIAFAIMALAIYLHMKGSQQLIWKITVALAIFNILLMLIFVLTIAKYANFCFWGVWSSDGSVGGDVQQQCKDSSHELVGLLFPKGGFASVVYNIPAAFWMYIGMESVVITGEEVKKPTESVSKGIRAVFWTVCLYSPPVLILGSIVPPGALATSYEIFPYMSTLSALFDPKLARLYMAVFYLPCNFSLLNTTLYALSRQSFALSRAGNFPKFLSITDPVTHRPNRRNKKRLFPQLAFLMRGGRVRNPLSSPESYISKSPTPRNISCQPLPHTTALSTSSSTSTSSSSSSSASPSPSAFPPTLSSPAISLSHIPSSISLSTLPTSPSPSLPSLVLN
eukprot:Phypoly_transcript_05606.p1 GENE.Phypoly_transcript_05606~~Phypoly_transcript_05606.p1  ORF type:complete len:500 (+),score=85.72 Phypoly_transcript_05606:241-1740(+)